ncbi:MAG TPA: chemotaxis protein CheA [Candidatus Limnocylindrales bacterium]|nr:chemotaxis protein CheA [Candidatus Limnocylindrales bacterium]
MTFLPDDRSSELRDLFFESAEEILQGMNEAGLALEENPKDRESLRSVRRAVHTLKGDSAACGFRQLSELAHELEDVLTPELAKENAGSIAEVVLTAADTFHEMLAAYRGNLQPPDGVALRDRIRQLLAKPGAVAPKSAATAKFEWTEYESLMIAEAFRRKESVYRVALHLDLEALLPAAAFELARKALESAGTVLALHPQNVAPADRIELIEAALSSKKSLDWIRQHCRVPSVVTKIDIEKAAPPQSVPRDLLEILLESEAAAVSAGIKAAGSQPAPASASAEEPSESAHAAGLAHAVAENTLRVDAGRIDTVMNLVGELIIGRSMLQRTIAEFERLHAKDPLRGKFADALAFQSRVLGELQQSVMKIRMVPVEQLFRRFPRTVRDVAKLRNKEIGLDISGQNTDLDKGILDALAEPLAHIVRNAADHGIELAPDRTAAGKPARGTIRLDAYHEGDHVVIEVSDDGRGLDRAKIVRRAIETGIITKEEAARLNESEALQLVFAPGLSTADEITEISGRGVGLDVVKSSLEALKGSVEIESEPGRGTTFRLLVPLTLASIQALLFRVNGRLYAVPLASVVEITRITEQEIHRVENSEVFQLREQVLTLVRLHKLGLHTVDDHRRRLFVIIIGAGSRRFGLAVDSLMGEEELVIKALEDSLVTSPLVSGASILGDGTVVLILNVPAVISYLSRIPPVGATA